MDCGVCASDCAAFMRKWFAQNRLDAVSALKGIGMGVLTLLIMIAAMAVACLVAGLVSVLVMLVLIKFGWILVIPALALGMFVLITAGNNGVRV